MRNSLCLGALVAMALAPGAAIATPIGVDESANSVIDVEFWGRHLIRSHSPSDPNNDTISYGDPVRGLFKIFTADAPEPSLTSYFVNYDDAVNYGRDTTPGNDAAPISFVTSRWLSPLPPGFDGDVSPLPSSVAAGGGFANDRVTIGDDVRFRPNEPIKDWFEVNDRYTALLSDPDSVRDNSLFMSVSTPLHEVIQGLGLNQEFELDVQATAGSGYGRFTNVIERYVVSSYEFVVDRLRVSKGGVCTP
jgi:hypothetical protein